MSFSLTGDQLVALNKIRRNNTHQDVHTAKWIVFFSDGKRANYLSEYCTDRESAFIAAVERFGNRVVDVK